MRGIDDKTASSCSMHGPVFRGRWQAVSSLRSDGTGRRISSEDAQAKPITDQQVVPEGHYENSPAFQGRVRVEIRQRVPKGRLNNLPDKMMWVRSWKASVGRPFGTYPGYRTGPGAEAPGYSQMSLRDKRPLNIS